MSKILKIKATLGIVGAGSFGTAMAVTAARAGTTVTLVTQSLEQAQEIQEHHTNSSYFPKIALSQDIHGTTSMADIKNCDAVMVAVPASALFDVLTQLKQILSPTTPVILTSKGMVSHNGIPTLPYLMHQDILNNPCVVLAGPNFAVEIVDNLPTATSIASHNLDIARKICTLFHHATFRTYPSQDMIGCQVAGVVKNVLAIGCGIVAGRALGMNTQAAVVTRGLAEMTRLGVKLGAQSTTFMGLAGIGDLMLTCGSVKSRNYSLGFALGQGTLLKDIMKDGAPLAEGYYSAPSLIQLASTHNVDMPLCSAVADVLSGKPMDIAMEELLSRPTSDHEFLEVSDVLVA